MSEVQFAVAAAGDLARDWPRWPVYGLTEDLLPTLERWVQGGHRIVVATLVSIVGTSPRPLGSEMAVCDTGEVIGYVSGGCVEGTVAAEALAVMEEGKPRLLDYGAGSPVLDVQLTCGGRIGIFARELADPADYVSRLRRARDDRQALEVHIDLHSGAQQYLRPGIDTDPPTAADPDWVFVKPHLPPLQLLVVGGNPVALSVCRLASAMGYPVGLLRPYGPAEPPPDLDLTYYDRRPLQQALADKPFDAWTAVYALTHHPDEDLAVLARALPSPAFSVGVLGSRTKINERLQRLGEAGIDDAARARLHAPAGITIGARGPREIALAIIGQIVSEQPRSECRAAVGLVLGATDVASCSRPVAMPACSTSAR